MVYHVWEKYQNIEKKGKSQAIIEIPLFREKQIHNQEIIIILYCTWNLIMPVKSLFVVECIIF